MTALLATLAAPAAAQREHPISSELRVPPAAVAPGGRFTAVLAVTIPSKPVEWHFYSITQPPGGPIRTTIGLVSPAFRIADSITGTKPVVADDPNFGMPTETHTDSAVYQIPLVADPRATGSQRLAVTLRYQVCNERYCLPPVTDTILANVALAGTAKSDSLWAAVPPTTTTTATPTPTPTGPLPGNGSLALFLWIAATMGALSLLTPCVFPMVPITISYFSRGDARGRGRALRDAGVYAIGIVAAFTAIGLGLALLLGATGLNRFAANPWLNLAIALLFAGFALSLFGVVNLGVPGSFVNRIDLLTRTSRFGRDGTTLLMGATFAVTTFTCTAPFVGTLLVAATQGDWLWPALGLLTFSGVFALPFVILALVPEALNRLPRSGEWMVTLKGVLAFLELAAAMKFLSNADLVMGWGVFTRNVVLGTWVVLGLGLIAYLLGVRLGRNAIPGRRHWIPAAVSALVIAWLATGLMGRRLGELEPFLPPAGHNAGGVVAGELEWMLDDYDGALARAKAENKLVLLDFTGYTCTNCRWMEANLFPRDEIERELEKFVRVRLFTDGQDESNARQQKFQEEKFNTVALPLYAVVDADGNPRGQFLGMTRNSEEFIAFLSSAAAGK
ncbi:MAG TPA: cytochrome c biogenesis protein CcdA [Gemmatimonadaceae bacterium]|nr:cytochrome c biogenesis protein CcdA [Gemmatimonadaceae bacterium]